MTIKVCNEAPDMVGTSKTLLEIAYLMFCCPWSVQANGVQSQPTDGGNGFSEKHSVPTGECA